MIAQAEKPGFFSPQTMIPDLLTAHPAARVVLDRYGLAGCGGRHGPVESLGFFAATHGVDEEQLLREIQQAAEASDAAPAIAAPGIADTIYRRFFLGGIVLILTAGATWGAWLLWQIGFTGKFTGISIHHVNAHGHAQIYGWVGLFIMGFAYQAFPRLWHTRLFAPPLAVATFLAMCLGIVLRTIGMTAAGAGFAVPLAMIGGGLELLSAATFSVQILITFFRSEAKLEPYIGFAAMALLWFVAQAGFDVWYTFATMTAASRETLLWYVATFQAPLRDLQIHGLALFMILGVSLRMLPALFDVPAVRAARAWSALAILIAAVAGEALLFIAYRFSGNHALAGLLLVPWLLLALGCWMVAGPWKLWRSFSTSDRSGKFVRVAYGWLAVSLIMLLLLPVYQLISQIPFSHAYYGAIRHAITVGFISMMIMGFAAKVVPTLNGIDPRRLSGLWGPFVLVNVGCFLRVSLQTLTDWHPGIFPLVGISGTLEVIGLAWWGTPLARIMLRGRKEAAEELASTPPPPQIDGEMIVLDVLRWFPQSLDVFERHGFTLLRNPIARRTLARSVTIAQAARLRGAPLGELLNQLNQIARKEPRISPLVSATIRGHAIP